jgi:hypothetical protein
VSIAAMILTKNLGLLFIICTFKILINIDDLAILVSVFENYTFKSRHSVNIIPNGAILGMGISHSPSKTHTHNEEEH